MPPIQLQVVLPVYNEAESIERTVREIYDEISPQVSMAFIVCEDGSTDGTKEVLEHLSRQMPMTLVTAAQRKGYLQAAVDGFRAADAPWVLALDSDGQCDPKDFGAFWKMRNDFDVIIGWRVRRADSFFRRCMSGVFRWFHKRLFGVPAHDPSCPFVLIRKHALDRLIPEIGALPQGLWWEFTARAHRRGFRMGEVPIRHRPRAAGKTRIFHWWKAPVLVVSFLRGLFRIWREPST